MCVQIIKHPMKKHKSGHNVGTEADILKTSHFGLGLGLTLTQNQ